MFERTVKDAEAQIKNWATREIQLTHQLREAQSRIAGIELAAGEALLDEPSPGDAAQPAVADPVSEVGRAHARVAVLKSGLIACRKRRADAVLSKRATEGAGLRKIAAEKSLAADVVEQKSTALLRKLSELNDIQYTDLILKSQPAGELISHGYQKPKSERLRAECAALMAKADALTDPAKLAEPPTSLREFNADNVTTIDVDTATLSILSSDVLNVPSASEVFDWFAAVDAHAPAPFSDHRCMIHLQWNFDGSIDRDASYIQVPDLGQTVQGTYTQRPVAILGTDMFRSQPQPKEYRW